jgi:predicted transcriptional regulator
VVTSTRKDRLLTSFTVRLTEEDITKLRTLAQQLDRTPSSVVRRLVRRAIPGGADIAFASARACDREGGDGDTDEE